MANNHFAATIYGEAKTFDAKNGGWQAGQMYAAPLYTSFPSAGVIIKGIPGVTGQSLGSINGVPTTANSIIEVLPTGSNHAPMRYFCDATVAALQTASA